MKSITDAYMAWSHETASGKTADTDPPNADNGHSLRVVDVFGMYITLLIN